MKRYLHSHSLLALAFSLLLAGCGTLHLSPYAHEIRPVQVASDPAQTIVVPEGMVFLDAQPANRGIRFPAGTYVLEAEDADYLYFRSAAPLEIRVFADGQMVDGRNIEGGLMLGKGLIRMVPAGAYIDGDEGEKILVWKLGKAFVREEGESWWRAGAGE